MNQKKIVASFALAMTVYVSAVFLWPSSIDPSDQIDEPVKTARLAGLTDETSFQQERFGVPSPEQVQIR